jgi:hypothetical protein
MPDNWGFVAAAYGLAALVLGGYWRYLRRRERELTSEGAIHRRAPGATAPSETSPKHSQGSGGKAAARTARDRA